jgi:rhodanese-related sulfurtransferase
LSQDQDVSRVTMEEVKSRIDRGEPIFFIDSRGEQAWSSSDVKIRGAMRIPPENAASLLSKVPKDRSVVIYCT